MTFVDIFVQVCKWFGYLVWFIVTCTLIVGPFTGDKEWKYKWQSIILGSVSGLFLIAYVVYRLQGVKSI